MYGMGPPLNQCPVFAHFLILLGLIHDADYERGAYFPRTWMPYQIQFMAGAKPPETP